MGERTGAATTTEARAETWQDEGMSAAHEDIGLRWPEPCATIDGATHERCDEQRDEIAALRGEVERLEGRRGALLAEIDRLRGAQ